MKPKIKLAFASGTDDLNRRLLERMRAIFPDLPLWVVSDFPPEDSDLKWIPYRTGGGFTGNWRRARAALSGKSIRLAGVMLVPDVPFRRMRLMALLLSPRAFLAFNENLNDFMLRPRCLPAILRHIVWRLKNLARWTLRTARAADWRTLRWYAAARLAGFLHAAAPARRMVGQRVPPVSPGISVVIPSRNGKTLLDAQLPGIVRGLAALDAEIIVVDNGSNDGTADWLRGAWPQVQVAVAAEPLSFARAVNRGIARTRHSHVCLLNNDMLVEPGFFAALADAFGRVPDLFCATAQIRFPAGVRREETGKTVMAQAAPQDFPIRCDEPLPGEDQSYVLYGSGGCSLFDAAKLRALGGVDEAYEPAYVEDLDLGYRAWKRGWPSVYVAGALVEHRHRATTSRYYTNEQLELVLETNYLKFLARAVSDGRLFRRLWAQTAARLRGAGPRPARLALKPAAAIAIVHRPEPPVDQPEESILALTGGA
ncbi:MAG: glycosyltransferase, partial [Acidobacteriia bacterium]|nr:glycosyltransferase [Terriglobia bacterium]